jgi:hypothetical protein
MWVHKKCSGVKRRLKSDSNYQCKKCRVNGATTTVLELHVERRIIYCWNTVKQLSVLRSFAMCWDRLCCGGGAGKASRVSVWIRCAWKIFRELYPILTENEQEEHLLS